MNKQALYRARTTNRSLRLFDHYRRKFSKVAGVDIDHSGFLRIVVNRGLSAIKKELK